MKSFERAFNVGIPTKVIGCQASSGLSFDEEDTGGYGGALSAIEGIVGIAGQTASTYIAANASQPVYAQGPFGSIAGGQGAVMQRQPQSSTVLLVGVLLVGFIAFRASQKG